MLPNKSQERLDSKGSEKYPEVNNNKTTYQNLWVANKNT